MFACCLQPSLNLRCLGLASVQVVACEVRQCRALQHSGSVSDELTCPTYDFFGISRCGAHGVSGQADCSYVLGSSQCRGYGFGDQSVLRF